MANRAGRLAVAAYAVAGSVWVSASSFVAEQLPARAWVEPVKGVAFVVVTAIVLAAVLHAWERAREATDHRYRTLIESSGEVVYRVSINNGVRFEYLSPGMADLLALPRDRSVTVEQAWRLVHPEDRSVVAAVDEFASVPNLRVLAYDGRVVHIAQTSQTVHDARGRPVAIDVRLRDVTSPIRDEAEVAVRSGIATWLDEGRPPVEVLTRACMDIVERFDVDLAWVGWRRADGGVDVLATGGSSAYLDGVEIRWDEGPLAQGPTGTAIREGRSIVARLDDPTFAPWRARAMSSGFTATLGVPVRLVGDVIGALNLYARFGVPFEPAAVARFERIATLVGFVLQRVDDVSRLARTRGVSQAVERMRAGEADCELVVAVAVIGQLAALRRSAGYAMGEDVVHDLEHALRAAAPSGAEVIRTGDDEVTLVAVADTVDDTEFVAVLSALQPVAVIDDARIELPVIIGWCGCVGPLDDPDVAYRRAVSAAVSADGRHERGIVWASDELASVTHDFATVAALRRGLADREFEVWYQPQLHADSARVVAAEALVRWRRADGTMVLPLDFLPVAERDGCIVDVGRAVLDRALADAKGFRAAGLERLSINASVRELVSPGYVDHLVELLQRHRLPASFLEIEVVETAELGPLVATVLADLHAAGIQVAVDDYGTGWSSMAYLVQFRFDTLKIDRLFVHDMLVDPRARSMVEATVSMGSALGVRVVAEGVEEVHQALALRDAGCHVLQGYAISRPVPADEFASFLGDWTWAGLRSDGVHRGAAEPGALPSGSV